MTHFRHMLSSYDYNLPYSLWKNYWSTIEIRHLQQFGVLLVLVFWISFPFLSEHQQLCVAGSHCNGAYEPSGVQRGTKIFFLWEDFNPSIRLVRQLTCICIGGPDKKSSSEKNNLTMFRKWRIFETWEMITFNRILFVGMNLLHNWSHLIIFTFRPGLLSLALCVHFIYKKYLLC